MKTSLGRPLSLCVVALSLTVAASTANAFSPRSPQVAFNTGPLQAYLNTIDPGINAATQQLNAQTWATAVTGNAEVTLMLRNGPATGAAIGVYNAAAVSPTLFSVLPAAAGAGWYATVSFSGGNLTVSRFDQNAIYQGQSVYPGVSATNFGFYIQGPGGLWYSQDSRNSGGAQMLTYDSPSFPGNYWLCFEATARTAASTFDGIVFNVQSMRASPADPSSWGRVKAAYR